MSSPAHVNAELLWGQVPRSGPQSAAEAHKQMQKMMKKMKGGGMQRMMRGLGGMAGGPGEGSRQGSLGRWPIPRRSSGGRGALPKPSCAALKMVADCTLHSGGFAVSSALFLGAGACLGPKTDC